MKSDATKVATADITITDANKIIIATSVLASFLIFPMLAFTAKAFIGPSKGESNIAPITVTGLSRKRPASAIIVANSAIIVRSLLICVNFSVDSKSLSKGFVGGFFSMIFSFSLSTCVETWASTL